MINLINRFLRWKAYRRKLAIRYRIATGKRLPWAFGMGSETAEQIIREYNLFDGRHEHERLIDKLDKLLEEIDD